MRVLYDSLDSGCGGGGGGTSPGGFPLPGASPFRLRGVVVHSGSFEAGHYTAAVRGRGDVWYYCDDGAEPRVVPVEFVLARQAYILIYER